MSRFASSVSRLTVSPFANRASEPTFTTWYSVRRVFVNPRFGVRRWYGIWPPSNQRGTFPPVRAFWPL